MASMTFLQLAQKLREKCGISGTGPVSCQNQTGELLRVVNWVNEAWEEIQELHDNWQWLRSTVSFTTTSQKATYAATAATGETGVANFGSWVEDSFRSYITSIGFPSEIRLTYLPYKDWRNYYQLGNLRNTFNRPTRHITVCPDKSLGLGMIPDSNLYTIDGEYYQVPTLLVNDTDVPAMPAKFHMLIVYKAMQHYAAYEAAPEVMDEGEKGYNERITKLEIDQLPDIEMAGSMA